MAAGLLVGTVLDQSTGQAIPARVYVTGADGRAYLPAAGDGEQIVHYDVTRGVREVYACVGAHPFRVEVPAGEVTVTVERGAEWVPLTRKLAVAEGQTVEEAFRLRRVVDMAALGWYSGDLHVHTPLERLPAMQLAEDLNVAFPITAWTTRHDQPPGQKGGRPPDRGELVRIGDTHVYWTLNTEYEIFRVGDVDLGAILLLGHRTPLTATAPPIGPIAAEARRQGAIIDWDKHSWAWSTMLVPVCGIDTIELSNNHMWRLRPHFEVWGVPAPEWMDCPPGAAGWAEHGFQAYYALLNCGFAIRPSAGTANGVHPNPLGHGRVYVRLDGGFDYERWVAGLKAGRSFATNGPMLLVTVDGMMPGERKALPAGTDATVEVNIRAVSAREIERVEVVVNGRVARRLEVGRSQTPGEWLELGGPVEISGTSWLAVRCFEKPLPDNIRFAHTGAVFFDDASRPLAPEKRQVEWLISTVERQLAVVEGKLPAAAVEEYREALAVYRKLAATAR